MNVLVLLRLMVSYRLLWKSKHQQVDDDIGSYDCHKKRREAVAPYYGHNDLHGHYHQEDISVAIIRPGKVLELHREHRYFANQKETEHQNKCQKEWCIEAWRNQVSL